MPAPILNNLPPPPTRASPADFSSRADSFLGALPTLVTQINALVTYWNAELDTTAFVNRSQATTITGTMTYTSPPILLASATSGRQTALTIGKGTTQRQLIGIENDGSLNIVPLNGAIAALAINGARVYTTAYRPTPADIGALAASAYTAEDVLAKLQTVTGGSGSTLDAASLAGEAGSFYRNAGNLNAGVVPDARLPTNIVRSTRRVNTNSGSGLIGGGTLGGDLSLAVDATVARRTSQNEFEGHQFFQSGAIYIDAASAASAQIMLRTLGGAERGRIIAAAGSNLMRYRSFNAAGTASRDFVHNGDDGQLTANSFSGIGVDLTNLNASAIDRGTLADARLPSTAVRSSRSINTGEGIQGGGNLGADRTFSVDSTVVRTSRTVSAGNGLTGGGNLGSNLTVSLGTPGSITSTSSNSVSSTSHTHYISPETVGTLMSEISSQAIGAYMIATSNLDNDSQSGPGGTIAGSRLRAANITGRTYGSTLSGTWKACGAARHIGGHLDQTSSGATYFPNCTLWQRVA